LHPLGRRTEPSSVIFYGNEKKVQLDYKKLKILSKKIEKSKN
jgi:hypothetical protein